MFIKKHPTRNEYIRAGDTWIRNFTKAGVEPLSLTPLFPRADQSLVTENEVQNAKYSRISNETIVMREVVIISDGHDFVKRQRLLAQLPKNVAFFAINKALRKWSLLDKNVPADQRKSINAYIINNPYPECLSYLPTESLYYPACIASSKTYYPFLNKYGGDTFIYEPSFERGFGRTRIAGYHIDDYRNPVCSAIGLAYRFGVRKLLLFGCDDSFEKPRDGTMQLQNGLWTYPQHVRSQEIIDANLYWLTHIKDVEIRVANWSDGPVCTNASYISDIQEAVSFFKEEPEEEGIPI